MLKNIIIPEKIGNYYLFGQKIIGFDLNKTYVSATKIYVSGKRNINIEGYFEEKLQLNESISLSERYTIAINNIISKAGKFDYLKVSLPSYLVIFKELTLPFTDEDKIRSILDFEIEPILPFAIDEAVADFIITKKDLKNKTTTILVAVARKKDVLEIIEPFKNSGISPSYIIVDIIGIYGIYKAIENDKAYKNEDIILIDSEFNYTNIAYLQNGQLKLVRSLQQGIYNLVKHFADATNIDFERAYEYISKYGIADLENEEHQKLINSYLAEFNSNISFTLASFKSLLPTFSETKKIVLTGTGTDIKNFDKFFSDSFNIVCQKLTLHTILENKKFTTKERVPNSAILSLSIAYPAELNDSFNLLQKDLKVLDENILKKQVFIAFVLILTILGLLIFYSYFQLKKLRNEINSSKTELTNTLKTTFEITDPAILRNSSELINAANTKVTDEENIWFSFSSRARFSFLKYLQELSTIIDKDAIGLNLKRLSIAEGLVTLEGEVKDFKGLEILENELNKSQLFSHVTIPQETKFTIKLTIKKNEENI